MNGDDGYTNGGGGGSVWCEFHVSESAERPSRKQVDHPAGHRPRKEDHEGWVIRAHDKYTKHRANDEIKGMSGKLPGNHPLITQQGEDYFVLIVDDARQIHRVEVDGNSLRIYVPIIDSKLPAGQQPRQVSLRWGLRVFAP